MESFTAGVFQAIVSLLLVTFPAIFSHCCKKVTHTFQLKIFPRIVFL